MRYLGIDYGSKKVGLALSDDAGKMGFPHSIIPASARLLEEVSALIQKERVDAVVIGESKTLSGIDNPIAQEARAFGARVSEQTKVPVYYESEVFTSIEARRAPAPAEGGRVSDSKERKTRAPKKRALVDASAAALILTSYLSRTHV